MRINRAILWLALTFGLIGGCASKPPESIARLPDDNPSLNRVRTDIDKHLGREIRWGGVISQIENKADRTWIEVVRFRLGDDGKPRTRSQSDGRFIASFDRFLDPLVYEAGHRLTVVGSITGKVRRPIGEFEYLFPIVTVEGSHLWKPVPQPVPVPYPYPWWYYDPWYPFPPHHHHRPWHYH